MKLNLNLKNTRVFLFLSLYIYLIIISVVEPSGFISNTWNWYIWLPLTTYVVFWEGRNYFKAYPRLFKKRYDMNTLIAVSSHILYIYSIINIFLYFNDDPYTYPQMWEGVGALILITNIGHDIEQKIRKSSLSLYEELTKLEDDLVIVVNGKKQEEKATSDLNIGDIILIKKGDMIPVDGTLLQEGLFDFANITGESKQINLQKGKFITSGAHNIGDVIKIKVTKTFDESNIYKIIESIENVSSARPNVQKIADQILKYFVPLVFLLSGILFIVFTTLSQVANITFPFSDSKLSLNKAISISVAVLAIACPCALGLSTPLIYAVSSLLAGKNGIIVNDPDALEGFEKVNAIAFDKTGTITTSKMKIVGYDGDKKYLPIIKSLEKNQIHPIAKAINDLKVNYDKNVKSIKSTENGIIGKWKNQNIKFIKSNNDSKYTSSSLFIENKKVLSINFESDIKKDVTKIISFLAKRNIKTFILSGDNENTTKDVASKIKVDGYYANQSPHDKVNIIKKLQNVHGNVAFVGDGFNDSISMKQSNISIAFESGSNLTNSLSDISLTKTDFNLIKKSFTLSKINNRRIKFSMLYAFAFNIIGIPIAAMGLLMPWMAATIMALSNVFIALNAINYRWTGTRKLKN